MNGHQRHLRLVGIIIAVQIRQQSHLLQEVRQRGSLFHTLLTTALDKVLHTAQELLQVLLPRQVLRIVRAVDVLADAALHDDAVSQLIGILLPQALLPSFHQLSEGIKLGHRAFAEFQVKHDGLLDDTPQADTMRIGRLGNPTHRRVTNASCRIVDDATQGLLIVRIGHHTEVGNDILYLLALVEAQSSINPVGYAVLAHLLLKAAALGIRAVEDSEIGILPTFLATDTLDVVTHDDGFLLVAIGGLQRQPLTLLVRAEHILVDLSFVLAYQTVGSLHDELCRTVVLLQLIEPRALVLLLEVQDIVDVGPTETVDALRIVAYHTDVAVVTGQQQHYLLLGIVGVLILVHQHIAEARYVFLADVLMVTQHDISVHQQVVKVHGVGLPTALRVPIIYSGHQGTLAVHVVLGPRTDGILLGQQQVVLGHRDAVCYAVRLVNLVVELHLTDDALHQRACIGLVVDGEVGIEANALSFNSQDAGKHAVECTHLQAYGPVLPYQPSYAFLHLAGSFVGEGQRQDVPWFQTLLQQPGYLVRKHTGLARPCTGNHQLRSVAILHSRPLALVQFV